jgi:hypothetical protein
MASAFMIAAGFLSLPRMIGDSLGVGGLRIWLSAVILVAAGSAAAVTIIAHRPRSFADVAAGRSAPPYEVEGGSSLVIVRSTATGDKTAALWAPHDWSYQTHVLEDGVAGSADGKVFVAAFTEDDTRKTALFRFSLTSTGLVAGFRQIPHAVISGLDQVSLAVSPDGAWAAISGTAQTRAETTSGEGYPRGQARIFVINTRTGRLRMWRGGLTRPGFELTFPSMSWGSARSLYVLAQWCRRQAFPQGNVACNAYHAQPVAELRVIDTAGPGGSLRQAPPVIQDSPQYPLILQAIATDSGKAIIALVRNGRHVSVVRIDARTGNVDAVLYRHAAPAFNGRTGPYLAFLAVDGTGRYVLVNEDGNDLAGWIHRGRYHSLLSRNGNGSGVAW